MQVLVASLLDDGDCLLEQVDHGLNTCLQWLKLLGYLVLQHLAQVVQVTAISDVAYCRHHLQLGGSLVDAEDASVAIQALALVLHDEAAAAMHRDGIVGILVGIL